MFEIKNGAIYCNTWLLFVLVQLLLVTMVFVVMAAFNPEMAYYLTGVYMLFILILNFKEFVR